MGRIVAIRKDKEGINAIRLDDGREFDTQVAIDLMTKGELTIDGVRIVESRDGLSYFRSLQDGDPSNNLDNLPTFGYSNEDQNVATNPKNTHDNGKEIVAVRRDGKDIISYKLNDGTVLREQEAVEAVRNNELNGYTIGYRNGEAYIRSYPDGTSSNNLSNLPEF